MIAQFKLRNSVSRHYELAAPAQQPAASVVKEEPPFVNGGGTGSLGKY
jgi:hypothetical protein